VASALEHCSSSAAVFEPPPSGRLSVPPKEERLPPRPIAPVQVLAPD